MPQHPLPRKVLLQSELLCWHILPSLLFNIFILMTGIIMNIILNQIIVSSLLKLCQVFIIVNLLPSFPSFELPTKTSRVFGPYRVSSWAPNKTPVPKPRMGTKQGKRRRGRHSPPAPLAVAVRRHRYQVVLGLP